MPTDALYTMSFFALRGFHEAPKRGDNQELFVQGVVVVAQSALEREVAGSPYEEIVLDETGKSGDPGVVDGMDDITDAGYAGVIGKGITCRILVLPFVQLRVNDLSFGADSPL